MEFPRLPCRILGLAIVNCIFAMMGQAARCGLFDSVDMLASRSLHSDDFFIFFEFLYYKTKNVVKFWHESSHFRVFVGMCFSRN